MGPPVDHRGAPAASGRACHALGRQARPCTGRRRRDLAGHVPLPCAPHADRQRTQRRWPPTFDAIVVAPRGGEQPTSPPAPQHCSAGSTGQAFAGPPVPPAKPRTHVTNANSGTQSPARRSNARAASQRLAGKAMVAQRLSGGPQPRIGTCHRGWRSTWDRSSACIPEDQS